MNEVTQKRSHSQSTAFIRHRKQKICAIKNDKMKRQFSSDKHIATKDRTTTDGLNYLAGFYSRETSPLSLLQLIIACFVRTERWALAQIHRS